MASELETSTAANPQFHLTDPTPHKGVGFFHFGGLTVSSHR